MQRRPRDPSPAPGGAQKLGDDGDRPIKRARLLEDDNKLALLAKVSESQNQCISPILRAVSPPPELLRKRPAIVYMSPEQALSEYTSITIRPLQALVADYLSDHSVSYVWELFADGNLSHLDWLNHRQKLESVILLLPRGHVSLHNTHLESYMRVFLHGAIDPVNIARAFAHLMYHCGPKDQAEYAFQMLEYYHSRYPKTTQALINCLGSPASYDTLINRGYLQRGSATGMTWDPSKYIPYLSEQSLMQLLDDFNATPRAAQPPALLPALKIPKRVLQIINSALRQNYVHVLTRVKSLLSADERIALHNTPDPIISTAACHAHALLHLLKGQWELVEDGKFWYRFDLCITAMQKHDVEEALMSRKPAFWERVEPMSFGAAQNMFGRIITLVQHNQTEAAQLLQKQTGSHGHLFFDTLQLKALAHGHEFFELLSEPVEVMERVVQLFPEMNSFFWHRNMKRFGCLAYENLSQKTMAYVKQRFRVVENQVAF